jgi:hypothetical protein
MITCTIGRCRAEKKEHTDKKESLYAYFDLLNYLGGIVNIPEVGADEDIFVT